MCAEARITGVEINPSCRPNPANPHTWLVLIGDEVGGHETRVMYGSATCFPRAPQHRHGIRARQDDGRRSG